MKCTAPAPIDSWSAAHSLNLFNMPQKAMDVKEQELSPRLEFLNAGGTKSAEYGCCFNQSQALCNCAWLFALIFSTISVHRYVLVDDNEREKSVLSQVLGFTHT